MNPGPAGTQTCLSCRPDDWCSVAPPAPVMKANQPITTVARNAEATKADRPLPGGRMSADPAQAQATEGGRM